MKKQKMLAVLLAGLITLSLAGCGADKTESTNSESANAESGITATVTDNASEPTAESNLPAESEIKQEESTAEKEKVESNAPADSGSKADIKKPAESNQQTQMQHKNDDINTISSAQTSAPIESKTNVTTSSESVSTNYYEPLFDIDYWVRFAKDYAQSIGLRLECSAVDCWDNPIAANAKCKYLERDIKSRLNYYAKANDITDVWIWAEKISDNSYEIYIGYA